MAGARSGDLPAALGDQDPMLAVREVSHSFGSVRAVGGATFSVARAGITGLIGPNGAGKSSMVGIICGTLQPGAGSVIFDGRDVTRLPAFVRARSGLVRMFQMSSEFGRLTVLENLLVAGQRQPGERLATALV
ncbi:MAG: ATP-binding cassette domain-containing protein, partial [Acidimicrobiales bacterium]